MIRVRLTSWIIASLLLLANESAGAASVVVDESCLCRFGGTCYFDFDWTPYTATPTRGKIEDLVEVSFNTVQTRNLAPIRKSVQLNIWDTATFKKGFSTFDPDHRIYDELLSLSNKAQETQNTLFTAAVTFGDGRVFVLGRKIVVPNAVEFSSRAEYNSIRTKVLVTTGEWLEENPEILGRFNRALPFSVTLMSASPHANFAVTNALAEITDDVFRQLFRTEPTGDGSLTWVQASPRSPAPGSPLTVFHYTSGI